MMSRDNCVLFGKAPGTLKSIVSASLSGTSKQKRRVSSREDNSQKTTIVLSLKDNSRVYLEMLHSQVSDSRDNAIKQIILRDVTEELYKQVGFKAVTVPKA